MDSIRGVEQLLEAMASGFRPDFCFFWGHRPNADGSLGKSCFSQWWPCPFEIGGERFLTAEHFMMAGKARLFGEEARRAEILKAPDPNTAKKLGRKVTPFDPEVWAQACFEIVVCGNVEKFGQTEALKEFLLNTGEKVLVEASPMDRIWGIGMGAKNENATNPEAWRGKNLLGFALMEARERLRLQQAGT